jgi:hypothetical protein
MTFALGPRPMDAENTPEDHDHDQSKKDEGENENADADEEQGQRRNGEQTDGAGDSDEQTRCYLGAYKMRTEAHNDTYEQGKKHRDRFHPTAQR